MRREEKRLFQLASGEVTLEERCGERPNVSLDVPNVLGTQEKEPAPVRDRLQHFGGSRTGETLDLSQAARERNRIWTCLGDDDAELQNAE